jgi:nucleotide-binding universal stress UspA family protein
MRTRKDLVKQQLLRVEGDDSPWRVKVKIGRPAAEIAHTARRRHAELVITGLNQHGVIDRLLGNETPIHIAQLGDTPLLAASAGFVGMPKVVVIATDLFSPGIDRLGEDSAARVLLAEAKTVYCVHVVPETETWGLDNGYWNKAYGEAVNNALVHLKKELRLSPDVHVEMITPTGDPAREILDFAAFSKIDLIVVGRREATMFERRIGGGIAAKLLRGANCSVLLLPPGKARRGARPLSPGETETVTDPEQWPARLTTFNRRNVGRRASLEIDDLDVGAQLQLTGYPLLGVECDHRSGKLDLMLGDSRPSSRHMRHGIPLPESLSILVGADGRDRALRVGYARGYALLTFDR